MRPSAVVAALVLFVSGCMLPVSEDTGSSDFTNAGVPPLPSVEEMPPMGSPDNQDTMEEFQCRFTSSRAYHQIDSNNTNGSGEPAHDPVDGEGQIPANSIPMKVGDHDLVRFEFEMDHAASFDSVWLFIKDGLKVVAGETRADGPFPAEPHIVVLELQVEATKSGHLGIWGQFQWELSRENASSCRSLSYGVTE